MSTDADWVRGICPQCNQVSDLSVMDFGPLANELICDECWSATEPTG